jgi:GTA TIM-barrel-like domain/Putative phage tail protein
MVAVILKTLGSSIGGSLAGGLGASFGASIGSFLGSRLERNFSPSFEKIHTQGARLGDIMVQSSAYGRVIADVYGEGGIAGNIIWCRPLKENAQQLPNQRGSHTNFYYSLTCAIAICQGEISGISRIWINGRLAPLSFAKYRLYHGTQSQMPDPLIQHYEGVGKTPAYRGIAYIVIEDFLLVDYHNHVPNFVFEVKRVLKNDEENIGHLIKNMVIIPGSGEFVYDTIVQKKFTAMPLANGRWTKRGCSSNINANNYFSKADALVALDNLQQDCPNLKWAAPVVSWFTNTLDARRAEILPGVEYRVDITEPDIWKVGGFDRNNAHLISQDINQCAIYGGSVNDQSMLRYLQELRSRGLNIMFYPMIFVDLPNKPWRGRITSDAQGVRDFFLKNKGYNDFILHYAKLVAGYVDAFVIASELIGLTRVKDQANNFPAVEELISLAAQVKAILGESVKVTYAADWSEYHHTEGGWYNMDALWASKDIDVIGIDAYFPLTNTTKVATHEDIINGWGSGEGYDFYYEQGIKKPLAAAYAWKNISWWWEREHYNPDGRKTPWLPKSKKIWFTEFGFPSVDACANQPNVFYDPASSEGGLPKYSKGNIDFTAQKLAIKATLKKLSEYAFIEEAFLWCYDARPYPFWPALETVWRDSGLWAYGHWVNGKLSNTSLRAIVADLCEKAGLQKHQYDCSLLNGDVDGFILAEAISARGAIEYLAKAYFFQVIESDAKLKFIPHSFSQSGLVIEEEELVMHQEVLVKHITPSALLPKQVSLHYLDKINCYRENFEHAISSLATSNKQLNISIPLSISQSMANNICTMILHDLLEHRLSFIFYLSLKYSYLEPADVLILKMQDDVYTIKIISIYHGSLNMLQVRAQVINLSLYQEQVFELPKIIALSEVEDDLMVQFLNLPFAKEIYVAAFVGAKNFLPMYQSFDDGNNYELAGNINCRATMGTVVNKLVDACIEVLDLNSKLQIALLSGSLNPGTHLALVGSEIIQFSQINLIASDLYEISHLVRGCFNSHMGHEIGERFILLDKNLTTINAPIDLAVKYKLLHQEITFSCDGSYYKPLAVCHLQAHTNENQDIILSWIRRARITCYNWDHEVPLLETQEQYDVDIVSNDVVIRTINVQQTLFTYNKTQILLDFNYYPSEFIFRIYQKSDLVGRGQASEFIYKGIS